MIHILGIRNSQSFQRCTLWYCLLLHSHMSPLYIHFLCHRDRHSSDILIETKFRWSFLESDLHKFALRKINMHDSCRFDIQISPVFWHSQCTNPKMPIFESTVGDRLPKAVYSVLSSPCKYCQYVASHRLDRQMNLTINSLRVSQFDFLCIN